MHLLYTKVGKPSLYNIAYTVYKSAVLCVCSHACYSLHKNSTSISFFIYCIFKYFPNQIHIPGRISPCTKYCTFTTYVCRGRTNKSPRIQKLGTKWDESFQSSAPLSPGKEMTVPIVRCRRLGGSQSRS